MTDDPDRSARGNPPRLPRHRRSVVVLLAISLVWVLSACDSAGKLFEHEPVVVPTTRPPWVEFCLSLDVAYPASWDTAVEVPFRRGEAVDAVLVDAVYEEVHEAVEESQSFQQPLELDGEILFESGTATINEAADAVLSELAAAALAQLGPGERLVVDGYVDDRGTPEYNAQLGSDRATAVVDRLLRHEPGLEGLVVGRGHGEDELPDPTCHGDCPANRKVVITVQL